MNPDTLDAAKALFTAHSKSAKKFAGTNVVICAPSPFIGALASKKGAIKIGVQDIGYEARGAFTGSVSALQAKSVGASYVLAGHSERRMAGDTDELVSKKVALALESGMKAILCVGEKERDENALYLRAVRDQIFAALSKIDKKKLASVIAAYEPVWAIGKSFDLAPKPQDVHEMAIYVRKVLSEIFGKPGLKVPILYGGAVSVDNAEAFLRDGGIDGLLVGRQSLDAESFKTIIEHASRA